MPFTASIQPLQDLHVWSDSVLAWVYHNPQIILLALVLAAGPASFWGWMWYKKVDMDADHRHLMYRTFLFGMLGIFPVYIINYFTDLVFNFDLVAFIELHSTSGKWSLLFLGYVLIGIYEEYSKFLIVREVDFKKRAFNRIVDGIEFAVAAALGFAFMENLLYFVTALQEVSIRSAEFTSIVIFRSIGSMLAHTLFSGIFGYYYGRAKFVGIPAAVHGETLQSYNLFNGIKTRASRLMHLAKGQHFHRSWGLALKQEELIAEGLFIAVLLHGLYNFLISVNLTVLIVPLVVIEYCIIVHELHTHNNLVVHVT